MAEKTSDWRPGPTVCRCCLAEGCYKDISTEYFWMGKREVYAEMLSDTLSVSIAYSQSGGPNSNSRLICESCISRLRDATDFKRQVLECEKTFMNLLDPGSSTLVKELQLSMEEVKVEHVKTEKASMSDDDFDDQVDFVVENDDDDDDDLDDEPLMKLASKEPKKEVNITELLKNSQVTVKRKAAVKAKAPPAKKAKKQIVIKPTASKAAAKATASSTPKTEKKKKDINLLPTTQRILSAERCNAKIILHYSTVYPFKIPSSKMACVDCDEEFEDPPQFRQHMKDCHPSGSNFTSPPNDRMIKVDCTEMKCRICFKKFTDLTNLAEHLKCEHRHGIKLSSRLGLVPFVLPKSDQWVCTLCDVKYPTLRHLVKHMPIVHFPGVTCEICGKGFANARNLSLHTEASHENIHRCRKCKQAFPTAEENRIHYKASPSCWYTACHMCNLRFPNYGDKEKHMREFHNKLASKTCMECGKIFPNAKQYLIHFKIAHTDDKLSCSFCPMEFAAKGRLERHLVTHTKERPVSCPVCDKRFSRKSVLTQHMWMHREEKRFKCSTCNKQFNQKVTYVAHLKAYHRGVSVSEAALIPKAASNSRNLLRNPVERRDSCEL